jgi:hypothetical protein
VNETSSKWVAVGFYYAVGVKAMFAVTLENGDSREVAMRTDTTSPYTAMIPDMTTGMRD